MSTYSFIKGTKGLVEYYDVDIKMFHMLKIQEMTQTHSFHSTMDWHMFAYGIGKVG